MNEIISWFFQEQSILMGKPAYNGDFSEFQLNDFSKNCIFLAEFDPGIMKLGPRKILNLILKKSCWFGFFFFSWGVIDR